MEQNVLTEIKDFGVNYLTQILNAMGLEGNSVNCEQTSDVNLNFYIDTHKNALIIGRDGKNLAAFTTLLKLAIEVNFPSNEVHLTIDAGGYLEYRINDLKRIALDAARNVLQKRKDFKLKPMNSYERRIIHEKLANYEGLKTESVGFGANRAIVVKYVGE